MNHGWLDSETASYFIDMELCSKTLEQEISEKKNAGELDANNWKISDRVLMIWALSIAKDVVSGLAYLHKLGAVHRDLKPRNGT